MTMVDTWAWLALAVKNDQYHGSAKREHRRQVKGHRRLVTTSNILGETISLLYRRQRPDQARLFINRLLDSAEQGKLQLVHVSSNQFRRAWDLRQKYQDKPNISFVDFTSMVVMQEIGITDVFTGDDHFRQVNLGFNLVP